MAGVSLTTVDSRVILLPVVDVNNLIRVAVVAFWLFAYVFAVNEVSRLHNL